jgi:hypothetical protein
LTWHLAQLLWIRTVGVLPGVAGSEYVSMMCARSVFLLKFQIKFA